MNDKELNQLEEILSGTGRYKLLDCSRKNLFDLPAGAFKLWHVIYSMESANQEAFPSLYTLVRESRMARHTVIKWKKYLLETGWLIKTGGTAAEHYSKRTQGSHQVETIRVDDPTQGSAVIALDNDANSNGKGSAITALGGSAITAPQLLHPIRVLVLVRVLVHLHTRVLKRIQLAV